MSKIRSLPYATPQSNSVQVDGWYVDRGEHGMESLENVLVDWDPAVSITVIVPVSVDVPGIYEDCFLGADAILQIALIWHSSGAGLKGRGGTQRISYSDEPVRMTLALQVEGTSLAKQVALQTILTLDTPSQAPKPFAPKTTGCVLWRSPDYPVQLEGEGSRFPTEVIDFSETHFANDAAWSLEWDPSDLHLSVLGDMRLYVNARHERVKQAVSTSGPEGHDIREAIRFDVARTLIYGALTNEEFVHDPDQYQEGTVGFAVRNLIRQCFEPETIENLSNQVIHPESFDPKLQERLQIFRSE